MKITFTQFKKAFTLAEVLITLVIIGVVATLTIPTAVSNYRKQEYVSRLKKTYSALAQVSSQIIAEQGSPINWVTSNDSVYKLYKSKLVNVKDCDAGSGCFEQKFARLNGSDFSDDWNTIDGKKLILSDGTQLMIGGSSAYSISPTCSLTVLGETKNVCIAFYVDVNGNKNPNRWGRDLFAFVLTPDGFYPSGYEKVTECSSSMNGWDCAGKVLRENAMHY